MRSLVLSFGIVTALGCAGSHSSPAAAPVPVHDGTHAPVDDPKALKDLDEAERTIEAVGSDCASACSALRRMNAARIRLCSPRTSSCQDAERREGDARKHVAAFCECPP